MKKEENLIHVKLEYDEAIQSKKDILSSEINLLRIGKSIERYKSLRINEIKKKLELYKKIKEIIIDAKKLQKTLPKLKIPEIIKESGETNEIKRAIKREEYGKDLDSELKEIQEKLRSLQ